MSGSWYEPAIQVGRSEICRSMAGMTPELAIPWSTVYFFFAATSDVPVMQAVLTLSANSCPSWLLA
jgi:hypothetical protein